MLPRDVISTFGVAKTLHPLAMGIDVLDTELRGGLPTGAVTEIFGEMGQGAWWLALNAMAQIRDKACALVEPSGTFYPPGAAALGVDLSRLLIIRGHDRKQSFWALERIARCKNIGATLAAIDRLTDTEVRRLQLAAEASGQALLLLRNPREASRNSWGALRLNVFAESCEGTRRIIVETLRARGGFMPRPVAIEIENGTNTVHLAAVLPHRAADARRASG